MPLRALVVETGESICSLGHPSLRGVVAGRRLRCPQHDCTLDLTVVDGMSDRRTKHFRHKGGTCRTAYGIHPESEAHRRGKEAAVAKTLETLHALAYAVDGFDFEVAISPANRIADAVIRLSGGSALVVECQLAKQTVDVLEARTDAYHSAGYAVVWCFGINCGNSTITEWSQRQYRQWWSINGHGHVRNKAPVADAFLNLDRAKRRWEAEARAATGADSKRVEFEF